MDERVCPAHVTEPTLRGLIEASDHSGECDYCDATGPTLSLWEIGEQCDEMIAAFFDPTTNPDDDSDFPDGESLADLLEREMGSKDLVDDLARELKDMWFDRDSMESRYGDDPHFEETKAAPDKFSELWDEMERSLKYHARLANPTAISLLESIFGPLLNDDPRGDAGAIRRIGPSTGLDRLFRARVFQAPGSLDEALKEPEKNLGAPPEGKGRAGRMNARGISVFYGATSKDIALAEVRPPVGSQVVVAGFRVMRPLDVLDLEGLEHLQVQGSKFDPKTRESMERVAFLRTLRRRLIRPVMPELEDEGYLVTQLIADFLATHAVLKLDGIIFPSAQHSAGLDPDGRNVILFNKASRDKGANGLPSETFEDTSDDVAAGWSDFSPEMFSLFLDHKKKKRNRRAHSAGRTSALSLALDRSDVDVFHIAGVSYEALIDNLRSELPDA